MRLLITHGYLLTGSGSNVYVQNLCRALVGRGHSVDLLCQDPDPLALDFVSGLYTAGPGGVTPVEERGTAYPGACTVYRPEIGDLLPVYVYDDYPGWRVKTFLDLTDGELSHYIEANARAIRAVLEHTPADALIANHSLPGPLIARRALEDLPADLPYLSIVHGSCLQYTARRSERYREVAREGLAGARHIVSPSPHGAGTIREDFPELAEKTLALSGGVDTDLFRPDAFDERALEALTGGRGRGPEQAAALAAALEEHRDDGEGLLRALGENAAPYYPRVHDRDAGERLRSFLGKDGPLVVYVGKLIHSKGVHSLLSAFVRLRRERPDARLLIIGFGTFREGLEAITAAFDAKDERALRTLVGLGKRLEGGSPEPLEHFELPEDLSLGEPGLGEAVEFTGPLEHAALSSLLPAADVAVVPSIFPEIFGLVAAEFAASGVVPLVADHSGLAEAGGIVGEGLPFSLCVSLEGGFEQNLAAALADYLALPEGERERLSRAVRENSVKRLSWGSLADDLVALAGG